MENSKNDKPTKKPPPEIKEESFMKVLMKE